MIYQHGIADIKFFLKRPDIGQGSVRYALLVGIDPDNRKSLPFVFIKKRLHSRQNLRRLVTPR